MRFRTAGSIALRVAAPVAALVAAAFALLRPGGPATTGPDRVGGGPVPTPPPGADDSLNPAVLVEGGAFLRGSHHPGSSDDPASPFSTHDERPVRRVAVAGFWMQEHELTNREYRRFDPGHAFPAGQERQPVVNVTWREAMAYAASLGGTLPTEAQWELAAEGSENRRYPLGEAAPTCERAHFDACDPRRTIELMARPRGATPDGIQDLAGNVWEWVMPVWFEPGTTPVNDDARRMRGGSYRSDAFFLRPSNENNGFFRGFRGVDVGFRVVWPLEGRG